MTSEEAIALARAFADRRRLRVSDRYDHVERFDSSWGVKTPELEGLDDGKWYWLVYLYIPDYYPSDGWTGYYDYHFFVDPETGRVIFPPMK